MTIHITCPNVTQIFGQIPHGGTFSGHGLVQTIVFIYFTFYFIFSIYILQLYYFYNMDIVHSMHIFLTFCQNVKYNQNPLDMGYCVP